jgi:hypothetical protein
MQGTEPLLDVASAQTQLSPALRALLRALCGARGSPPLARLLHHPYFTAPEHIKPDVVAGQFVRVRFGWDSNCDD